MEKYSKLTLKGSYYFDDKSLIKQKLIKVGVKVYLENEPENEYDEFAVSVFLLNPRRKIGYLPKTHSKKFSNIVSSKKVVSAIIDSIEKAEKPLYKITIKITYESKEEPPANKYLIENSIEKISTLAGVYIIKSIINNKVYVGSSANIRQRAYQHINSLINNIHGNTPLQSDYNLYGGNNFKFEVIKQNIHSDDLIFEESNYLSELRLKKIPLYNMTIDGKGVIPKKLIIKDYTRTDIKPIEKMIYPAENKKNYTNEITKTKNDLSFGKTLLIVFVVLFILLFLLMNKYSFAVIVTFTITGSFFFTIFILALNDYLHKI